MKKRTLIFVSVFALSLLPAIVLAQCTNSTNGFVPLSCAQSSPLLQQAYGAPDLSSYFNAIFQIALSVGAILAVLQIVRAGYLYMLKDSFSVKQDAKEIFGDAIIGLLILLSVWLILDQIDPNILNLNFVQTDFQAAPQSTAQPNVSPAI